MNIKENSWHYKLIRFYRRDGFDPMPKTDCSYFWTLIGFTLLSLSMAFLVFMVGTIFMEIVVVAYFFGLYTWIAFGEVFPWEGNAASAFIVLNFIFIIVAICFSCAYTISRISNKIKGIPEEDSILLQRFKNWKGKMCSPINYIKDKEE